MQTLLLRTKFFVPAPRPSFVLRSRLTERLNDALTCKLTVISAPAGFGKTTLLSTWVRRLGRPTAWISLDRRDNEPLHFWACFVQGLRTVHPNLGQDTLGMLTSPYPPPMETLVTGLVNELAELRDSFILVLDDYHLIDASAIHEGVAFLLDHLPPSLHLVLSSRTEPALPLARWRVRNELLEVRIDDLRFTLDEAAAFLNETMDLGLGGQDVGALAERTEGWVAGLQMAAVSLKRVVETQGSAGQSEFIKGFTGSHRFVLDYLMEEVFAHQPADVQEFLLKTCVLDRLSAPLCDAVARVDGSQEMLRRLERDNLFLVALDDERRWYRYHHLFAELLRTRLEQMWPALVPGLHARASEWCATNGLIEEAVDHAFASKDLERAARLVDQFADQMDIQTNLGTLRKWLDQLPAALVHQRPWLSVYEGWARHWTGQRALVEESLQYAELALDEANRPDAEPARHLTDAERRNLAGHIAAIRAHQALTAEQIPRVLEMAQRALEQLPEDHHMRCEAAVALGGAHWALGNSVESQRGFELARTVALRHSYGPLTVSATCYVGMIQFKRGLVDEAYATFRQALDAATGAGGRELPIAGFPNIKLGDLLRERNQLAMARDYVVRGVEQCRQLDQADVLADSYVALARLELAQGNLPAAAVATEQADAVVRRVKVDPFVICWLDDCHVRLALAQGNLDAAAQCMEERGLSADGALSYHYDLHHLNLARVLVAQSRLSPQYLAPALELIDRLQVAAQKAGWIHDGIRIAVLQALARQTVDGSGSVAALRRALEWGEPRGYRRVFLDEGTPMIELLRQAIAAGTAVDYARHEYAHQLLGDLAQSRPPAQAVEGPSTMLVEPLSKREMEVLELVAEGLSNEQIAQKLVVSLVTVKYHTGNIYGKLGVKNRTRAVAKARELGLLPLR